MLINGILQGNMSKPPLISIITVTYNAAETLEKAIQSVIKQVGCYEYIIIDGGSTDGTIELINKYENQLSTWISEPDKGIYDAMNKGIDRAKGEWIYFLGADDQLLPTALEVIQHELSPNYSAIFGEVVFDTGATMQSALSIRTLLQNTVHHQSVFYNKGLFAIFRYDVTFRAIADYELNLIIWIDKLPFKQVSSIIAICNSMGTSSEFSLSLQETNQVRAKHIKSKLFQKLLTSILWCYYAQKKVRGVSMVGSPV